MSSAALMISPSAMLRSTSADQSALRMAA